MENKNEILCRYCQKEIAESEATFTTSYWGGNKFPCHKACKEQGYKDEAYQCQLIDGDCNDCKHFQRGDVVKPPYKYYKGFCLKFNKPTNAFPLTCTDHKCFEHRKNN